MKKMLLTIAAVVLTACQIFTPIGQLPVEGNRQLVEDVVEIHNDLVTYAEAGYEADEIALAQSQGDALLELFAEDKETVSATTASFLSEPVFVRYDALIIDLIEDPVAENAYLRSTVILRQNFLEAKPKH